MNPNSSSPLRPRVPFVAMSLLLAGALLLAACSPIVEAQMRPWEETRVASLVAAATATPLPVTPEPTATPTPAVIIVSGAGAAEDAPTATIGVPVLRVRAEPSTDSEQIGVVYADQIYPIIGRSSDGLWMKLGEIPGLPDESGWVISELALVIGDFSLIPVVQVPDGEAVAPSRSTEETSNAATLLPTPTPQPALIVTLEGPASGATPIGESTNGSGGTGTDGTGTDGTGTDGTGTDGTGTDGEAMETPVPAAESAPMTETTPLTDTAMMTETAAVTETAATTEATPTEETPVVEPPVEETPEAAEPPALAEGVTGGATLPDGVEPPPSGFALVVTDGVRLRVRDLPSLDSMIVGYAYSGETFRVLDQSADGVWTQINGSATSKENASGGWVATEFLYISR